MAIPGMDVMSEPTNNRPHNMKLYLIGYLSILAWKHLCIFIELHATVMHHLLDKLLHTMVD